MPDLRILLLGAPVAEADGLRVVVDTRKAIALLAYLAVEARPCRRDALAVLLWPDYEPEHARGALRRTLSSLKAGLGGRWLAVDRGTVSLETESVWSDIGQLSRTSHAVTVHEHNTNEPCADCRAVLEAAAGLYRGEFMEGFSLRDSPEFEDWQLRRADEFKRSFGDLLERLIENLSAEGDLARAADHARRWLSLDLLHEPAHRRLMHIYALQGRRSDALRQFQQLVSVLDEELGVAPLAETTELYEAILNDTIAPLEPSASPPPLPELGPALAIPLVGRDAELRTLREVLGRAAATGQLLVIEGEAGVGKSRLVEDHLQTAAREGSRIASARCYEDELDLAFSPLAEALRGLSTEIDLSQRVGAMTLSEAARLVPELAPTAVEPPRIGGPGAQRRFVHGVTETIFSGLAGTRPGVLFIDDVHWADEASIDLLTYAIRRLEPHRAVIMVAWRPELMPGDHRLRRATLQVRAAGNGTIISLNRLGPAEVIDIVAKALPETDVPSAIAERLYEETEGLPFFVVEYLTALRSQRPDEIDWQLPAGAADLLAARVASVGELSRQVLTAGAVIGRSFDFDTLRESSGRGDDETVSSLDELVRGGLVREVGGSDDGRPEYDFSHERLRSFVYDQAGLARRRLLHKRVAEALAKRPGAHGDAGSPAMIARHYRLGGAESEAAHYFKMAGEQSAAVFAHVEALAHFESALALGHPEAASIRESVGDACTLLGRYRDAVRSYQSAAALAPDSEQLSVLEHKLGQVHHRRGDWQAAENHYASALDALGDAFPELAARISADRSLTARSAGRTAESFRFADRALELAEEAGNNRALAQAHNILGILNGDEGNDEAQRHLETSLHLAQEAADDQARVAALNNLALFFGRSGAVDRAIEMTREGLAVCAALGDRHREAALHNNLADLLRQAGRLPDAISEVKIAVGMFSDIGTPEEMEPEIWKLVEW
ncbi:MAG: ATP-binding protein [Actinomycetota bacterium]